MSLLANRRLTSQRFAPVKAPPRRAVGQITKRAAVRPPFPAEQDVIPARRLRTRPRPPCSCREETDRSDEIARVRRPGLRSEALRAEALRLSKEDLRREVRPVVEGRPLRRLEREPRVVDDFRSAAAACSVSSSGHSRSCTSSLLQADGAVAAPAA